MNKLQAIKVYYGLLTLWFIISGILLIFDSWKTALAWMVSAFFFPTMKEEKKPFMEMLNLNAESE